ncbi:MAG: hypothetical protein U0556_11310 [Dehalococcoidia bacterium]
MFIVQGVIRVLRDPATVRAGEESYDSILHQTEGMYWNIYLERIDDPSLTIHTQDWKEQATSEAFGVSPAFQAHRKRGSTGGGPLTGMDGPLSPGYWKPVLTAEIAPPPTGRDVATLGVASHSIVFVRPGREADYLAAERAIAERLKSIDGVFWIRAYHSLGQPNAFSRIIHWRDIAAAEAGIAALGEAETARQSLIDRELGGLCRVKLFSDWPERRSRDRMPL